MDETITSSFNKGYYLKAIGGAILFLWLTGYMVLHCLLGDFAHPDKAYPFTLILLTIDVVYFYFFSQSWKRITVTATEIIVYSIVFRKQTNIALVDITHVGTYRMQNRDGNFGINSQNFVIEFNDDQHIGFNEVWYDNYGKLTMAIYNRKYGPGHGRERYLERHQR